FMLYDTYGFPLDLTQVMAEERGMSVDVQRFNELMEQQREQSRAATGSADARQALVELVQQETLPATAFLGYNETFTAEVNSPVKLYRRTEQGGYSAADELPIGAHGAVVVEQTPFYAEAGGQVGDQGVIEVDGARFRVEDTLKFADTTFHLGHVEGSTLRAADSANVSLRVDEGRRRKIMANHTSTHILNRALRVKVNPEADQKGSLVDDQKLRFDFSQRSALSTEQIGEVESMVSEDIAADLPVHAADAPQRDALRINGLRAVFGEKYPDPVRVVAIGPPMEELLADPENEQWKQYSVEFCGGTHLARTGQAEAFAIVSEEAVAKGVRRVTALTGEAARDARHQGEALLQRLEALRNQKHDDADRLRSEINELQQAISEQTLPATVRAMLNAGLSALQRTLKDLDKRRSQASAAGVVDQARQLADETDGELIVARFDEADGNALRTAVDVMRKKKPDAALLLAGVSGEKVAIVAAVPKDKIDKGLKAGDWVKETAKVVGGGGGGKPDMAQAGGKDPSKVEEALETAREFAANKL
ncbi:MAG: alanine--tRNA ligase-related protein, partial [Phycisphaeraceae bacterium]